MRIAIIDDDTALTDSARDTGAPASGSPSWLP
jgi:hypothetical protein